MANKRLFGSTAATGVSLAPPANVMNEAGGLAYSVPDELALAVFACTGTFSDKFYSSADQELAQLEVMLRGCRPEFVAKAAVYARESGFMKDMPAYLAAWLWVKHRELGRKVFQRIISNGKMLRNFVQFIRSGRLGRKSLSAGTRKAIAELLNTWKPEVVFDASVGNDPSLADVIKLAHPKPTDAQRRALLGYIIGKSPMECVDSKGKPTVCNVEMTSECMMRMNYSPDDLPSCVQEFEQFKKAMAEKAPASKMPKVPDLPFQMLDSLGLSNEQWKQIAIARDRFMFTLMNLNTFARHGVMTDASAVSVIAKRLSDTLAIVKNKIFPYKMLCAYKAADGSMPREIMDALHIALENSLVNVPALDGNVAICVDVSGSMSSAITGNRGSATSEVHCIDVAALFGCAIMRKSVHSILLPFSEDVEPLRLEPRDSVMTNALRLAGIGGGGTRWDAPLEYLVRAKVYPDLVVYFSDMQGWMSPGVVTYQGGTRGHASASAHLWAQIKAKNPKAKIVSVNLQSYDTVQVPDGGDSMLLAGWNDQMFEMIKLFAAGEYTAKRWIERIEQTEI